MAKNGRQKLWAVKWKMFPKKGHPRKIFGREILFSSPKLGAKSPPMGRFQIPLSPSTLLLHPPTHGDNK